MNGRYLRELSDGRADPARWRRSPAAPAWRRPSRSPARRSQTLADFWPLAGFIFDGPADDPKAARKWLDDEGRAALADGARCAGRGRALRRPTPVEAALDEVVEARGAKPRDVFQPVRVALAGTTVSPGSSETLVVLGRDESLRRIDAAAPAACARRPPGARAGRPAPRLPLVAPGLARPASWEDPGVPGTAGAGEGGLNRTPFLPMRRVSRTTSPSSMTPEHRHRRGASARMRPAPPCHPCRRSATTRATAAA